MNSDIQREELINIIKAFSKEEMELFVSYMSDEILWSELIKRYDNAKNTVERVKDVFHSPQDNTRP